MNIDADPQIPTPAPRKTWVDRAQAFFEVFLLSGVISSLFAALPFAFNTSDGARMLDDLRTVLATVLLESVITLALLTMVMRAHREPVCRLGLSWQRLGSGVLTGLAIVPVLFALNQIVALLFQAYLPRYVISTNPLTELIRTPLDLILFILTALFAGGFKEELQRAFILRRFQRYLGGASLGLIVWSVAFGLGHYVQGVQAMVSAGLFGFIFGITYMARGSLTAPMVAHAAYDTVALLGYWFFKPYS